jgi:hypothetical protein
MTVGLVGFILVLVLSPRDNNPQGEGQITPAAKKSRGGRLGQSPATSSPGVGEEGQLRGLGLKNGVWLALDEDSWNDMLDAQNKAAQGGPGAGSALYRLAESGKIRIFPIGTRVSVVKTGFASRQVEILEGEDRGKRGWVQLELVSPP